jgi:hypothetical protein
MWIGKSYSTISVDVAPEPSCDYVDSLHSIQDLAKLLAAVVRQPRELPQRDATMASTTYVFCVSTHAAAFQVKYSVGSSSGPRSAGTCAR